MVQSVSGHADEAEEPLVTTEIHGRTALITLNRPARRNAVNRSMVLEILDIFDRVDGDDEIRAMVFTGAGRSYSVGADLEGGKARFGKDPSDTSEEAKRDIGGILALRTFACKKPVIAAINGDAVGIGATSTLPMDIRLASTTARFAFPFTRRGIVPETCASWFLPRVVGISRSLEWTFDGGIILADEALAAGLVRSLHDPEDLLPTAMALAERLTRKSSPVSVAATRQLLWHGLTQSHPMENHRQESELIRSLGGRPDAVEGISSFFEKRSPEFVSTPSTELAEFESFWAPPPYAEDER